MNYPVWETSITGGGFWVLVTSSLHLFLACLTAGNVLFTLFAGKLALRKKSAVHMTFVRRHAGLVYRQTIYALPISGAAVAMALCISSPEVAVTLGGTYGFLLATAWILMAGLLVGIASYRRTLFSGKAARRRMAALLSGASAVGYLLIIVYVVTLFTLTGTAGPFPASALGAAFVTYLALALALGGVCGLFTTAKFREPGFHDMLAHYCLIWAILPVLATPVCALWQVKILPPVIKAMLRLHSPDTPATILSLAICYGLFVAAWILAVFSKKTVARLGLTFLSLVFCLNAVADTEQLRVAALRPWLIPGQLYANRLPADHPKTPAQTGLLSLSGWVSQRAVTSANMNRAGRELFRRHCLACHAVGGPLNDILPLTAEQTLAGLTAMLDGQGLLVPYMPVFPGTPEERQAVAEYIVKDLHAKTEAHPTSPEISEISTSLPPFSRKESKFVLLAWSETGLHSFSDCDAFFSLAPPGSDFCAQVVRRGPKPEVVTEGIDIHYRLADGYLNSAANLELWDHMEALFGYAQPFNRGTSGKGLLGKFEPADGQGFFRIEGIPASPYREDGAFMPYPLILLEARDRATGETLARTAAVAPVSTEIGCRNCHGGPWKKSAAAGISDQTATAILRLHDRHNRTSLLAEARNGQPSRCQSCHNAEGELPDLSTTIHGWHANHLTGKDAATCRNCHPAEPLGHTAFSRDSHGHDCAACHGLLEDHALSLLDNEANRDKPAAARLARNLQPRADEPIKPREPWTNQPDCRTCHQDFSKKPRDRSAFNRWTAGEPDLYRRQRDDTGLLLCAACHGSAHATYPAENIYGKTRDNIQPLQYQQSLRPIGSDSCQICHIKKMEQENHHGGILPKGDK